MLRERYVFKWEELVRTGLQGIYCRWAGISSTYVLDIEPERSVQSASLLLRCCPRIDLAQDQSKIQELTFFDRQQAARNRLSSKYSHSAPTYRPPRLRCNANQGLNRHYITGQQYMRLYR